MFTKKRAELHRETASDVKASRGRHARTAAAPATLRPAASSVRLVSGAGAYACFGGAASVDEALAADGPQTADARAEQQGMVGAAELERKFQEFFRMGAVVAIGELFDEGMLGDKRAVAADVRDYLISFGVGSLEEVRSLGVTGPYLDDFASIFGEAEHFPPAAA